MQVLSREHVRMSVWERGAGRTLACGTGTAFLLMLFTLEMSEIACCIRNITARPMSSEQPLYPGRYGVEPWELVTRPVMLRLPFTNLNRACWRLVR